MNPYHALPIYTDAIIQSYKGRRRGDGVGLEGGDQRRHQVGNLYGSGDLGRDTVVETPFDCNVP